MLIPRQRLTYTIRIPVSLVANELLSTLKLVDQAHRWADSFQDTKWQHVLDPVEPLVWRLPVTLGL